VTGPRTPTEAAQFLWNRTPAGNFPHVMDSKKFKINSFFAEPEIRGIINNNQTNLDQFKVEWARLRVAFPPPLTVSVRVPNGYSDEVNDVYDDMKHKYDAWVSSGRRDKRWRGAWLGAETPGSNTGARAVPKGVIDGNLRGLAESRGWHFSDSWSGGASFHKGATERNVDFIYHLLPP
jgi:hypothetical protein